MFLMVLYRNDVSFSLSGTFHGAKRSTIAAVAIFTYSDAYYHAQELGFNFMLGKRSFSKALFILIYQQYCCFPM